MNRRAAASLLLILLPLGTAARAAPAVGALPDPDLFEKRIRPLLAQRCVGCHGPAVQSSGLRLDRIAAVLKGGARGAAVVPGDPETSLLIRAVRYASPDLRMPPAGKLPDEQIADLVAWVRAGASGPADAALPEVTPRARFDMAARRRHWAYQPIRAVRPPPVRDAAWAASPVDRFLLAKLERRGLTPAPPANRRTLIRRVTFDLTGLPPTPSEVAAFLADHSPRAYERVVGRLLASPRYGERWARHWLDLVRYAETLGHEFDYDLPNAWRYRDYVIRAFNADVPYDRFLVEHVAGDLLPRPRRNPADGSDESIAGTGFFWLGDAIHSPVDVRQTQADRIANQIDVFGKAFLGQTIACARCHDHKFDAISTRDYYALAGYLKSSRYQQAFLDPPRTIRAKAARLRAMQRRLQPLLRRAVRAPWTRAAAQSARYLLAARQALCGGRPPGADSIARAAGLDPARLRRWVAALGQPGLRGVDHPMHGWSLLAACGEHRDPFEARQRSLAAETAAARASAERSGALAAFSGPGYGGWSVTGDAFGSGPAPADVLVPGADPARPIARIAARGGADSGLVADRLEGVLRSPTFTLDSPFIHVLAAGRAGRVHVVIDGFTMIRDPIYGGLTLDVDDATPSWHALDVSMWRGHRAYLEIADTTTPLPAQDAPTAGRGPVPLSGWIRVEAIRFSRDRDAPAAPHPFTSALLVGPPPESVEALAGRYQRQISGAVARWLGAPGDSTAADIAALNWLIASGLLDGDRRADSAEEASAATAPGPAHAGGLSAPGAATSVGGDHGREIGDLAGLLAQYRLLAATLPRPACAPAMADGTGEDETVFVRGNYRTPGPVVPRRFLEALCGPSQPRPASGSGRLELAGRLVSPASPLVARVLVNRVWGHLFGRGIVRTPDDFGRMGEPPTHPELLDYLAAEFMRDGWSVKRLIRRLVLTRAYGMSSRPDPRGDRLDPNDALLHRMPVLRLEGEALRDAMLAVSGRLDRRMFGPGVPPYLTPFMEGRGRPAASGPLDGDGRRSVYLAVRRNFLNPIFLAFDYPTPFTTVGRRTVSNVPAQALALMNDPFVVAQARFWAARVVRDADASPASRVARLYDEAFSRPPSPAETRAALAFVASQSARYGGTGEVDAWADLCHVLFNTKEFVYLP